MLLNLILKANIQFQPDKSVKLFSVSLIVHFYTEVKRWIAKKLSINFAMS